MQPLTSSFDYSHHSRQDQMLWLAIQGDEWLLDILRLCNQTEYLALAQAASIYGSSRSNARRVIKSRFVDTGLLGFSEIRGNGYLYLRTPGARLATGDVTASGVKEVPPHPDRTLAIAFARAEFYLKAKEREWQFVPGHHFDNNLDLARWKYDAVQPQLALFQQVVTRFNSGIYPFEAFQTGDGSCKVGYVIIDLERSASAYQELFRRLSETTKQLYNRSYVWALIIAGDQARTIALQRVLSTIKLKGSPLYLGGRDPADDSHLIDVVNLNYRRFLSYGFHR